MSDLISRQVTLTAYLIMMSVVSLCYTGFAIGAIDVVDQQGVNLLARNILYILKDASYTSANTIIVTPNYIGMCPDYNITYDASGDNVIVRTSVNSLLSIDDITCTIHTGTSSEGLPSNIKFEKSNKYKIISNPTTNSYSSISVHEINDGDYNRPYLE